MDEISCPVTWSKCTIEVKCSVLLNLDLRFRFIHLPNMCSSVSFAVLPQKMQSSEGLMAQKASNDDQFDKKEAKARFEAALRGARITGHKPMTDIPKKRVAKKSKPKERPGK
jgi:hypothetical protein